MNGNSSNGDSVGRGRPSLSRQFTRGGLMRKAMGESMRMSRPVFDLSKPTHVNYMSSDKAFYGPYASVRADLDYSYHSNYNQDRQRFQDNLIGRSLKIRTESMSTPSSPWVVFTAGVMGSGKRHTIHQLIKENRFPLLSFVYVDPDEIRRQFPEYVVYAEKVQEKCGEFTRKEAGYIAEIMVQVALNAGKNVILDGVLKDADWTSQYFAILRQKYPKLRIALLHIVAPKEAIVQRVQARGKITQRRISQEHILESIDSVADSVIDLFPRADYYCTIRNDPQKDDVELLKEGETWENFRNTFVQYPRRDDLDNDNDDESTPTELKREKSWTPEEQAEMQRVIEETLTTCPLVKKGDIDFSILRSTEENYAIPNKDEFYGPHAHLRKRLDYSYHSNYVRDRQMLQDAIIQKLMHVVQIKDINGHVGSTPQNPWIVFTAGAMGAGKSYTIRKIVEAKRFPLQGFVGVDPDEIRRHLPEFLMYATLCPEKAGDLTNKECGYVAEILTLVALEAGMNVLVDGSLRDHEWYGKYFRSLRKDYSKYGIAIVHVSAPFEAVVQRAEARAAQTGRMVPRKTLEMAYQQVPNSVRILEPLADYCCELLNAPNAPDIELVHPKGEDWDDFQSHWFQVVAFQEGGEQRDTPFAMRRVRPSDRTRRTG